MDKEKIKELALAGKTKQEIAAELGISERSAKKTAESMGLKLKTKIVRAKDPAVIAKVKELIEQGKTNLEIAKELGISPTTARKYTKECLGLDTNSVKAKRIKEVSLSQEQLEIIYGSLLGDLCITKTEKLARFVISQGGNHEAYFDHLCSKFPGLMGKISKTPRYDKRTDKWYNKFVCKSLAHELYLEIYNKVYINGVKQVTPDLLDHLTLRGVAYWFMDDGSVNANFATNGFTLEEVKLLQEALLEKFDIPTWIYAVPNKEQYVLTVSAEKRKEFEDKIRPYMHESMYYKLRYK